MKTFKQLKESVTEAANKSSDVYKEYLLLKKKSIADLRKMIGQIHRGAVDLKSYDKEGAISDLLVAKFGKKAVIADMGLNEATTGRNGVKCSAEKSQFGGYRAICTRNGKGIYSSQQSYTDAVTAKKHAEVYADTYYAYGDKPAQKAVKDFVAKNKSKLFAKEESVDESLGAMIKKKHDKTKKDQAAAKKNIALKQRLKKSGIEVKEESVDEAVNESFKKGDKVKIKNVKSYDVFAKNDTGTVIGMNAGKVQVKVGTGSMNVDPKDLVAEAVNEATTKFNSIGDFEKAAKEKGYTTTDDKKRGFVNAFKGTTSVGRYDFNKSQGFLKEAINEAKLNQVGTTMVKVKKGNKVREIAKKHISKYQDMGWEEVNEAVNEARKYSVLDTKKNEIVRPNITKAAAQKLVDKDPDNRVMGSPEFIHDKRTDALKEFFNLGEATVKVKTTMADEVVAGAKRFGVKATKTGDSSTYKSGKKGDVVALSGSKGKINDYLDAIIGRGSMGDVSTIEEAEFAKGRKLTDVKIMVVDKARTNKKGEPLILGIFGNELQAKVFIKHQSSNSKMEIVKSAGEQYGHARGMGLKPHFNYDDAVK